MASFFPAAWRHGRARLTVRIDRLRGLLRVLWACRVSLLGVALPGLLLLDAVQARDLLAYYSAPLVQGQVPADVLGSESVTVFYWALFSGLAMGFWCFPVHQSARLLLYHPDWLFTPGRNPSNAALRRVSLLYRPAVVWLPRLFGASIFLILALAAHLARRDLPSVPPFSADQVTSSQVIGGMLWFLQYAFAGEAVLAFVYLSQFKTHGLPTRFVPPKIPRDAPLLARYRLAIGDVAVIASDVATGRIWLAMIGIAFVIMLLAPVFATHWLVLALLLPVIGGAWVPIFSWLAYHSHRTRLPLIALFLVLLVGLTYAFGDKHDLTLASEAPQHRPTLAEAVRRWKAVNCTAEGCPRPIIVSTAGGASRAAFFTLTVLGDLMDFPSSAPRTAPMTPPEQAAAARLVTDRLFAVSGVSGGAVGAAIFSASLANSPDGLPPCNPIASSRWFRAGAPTNWRGCMQAIVAEDFLSQTIIGLIFRDNLSFLGAALHWHDRAAVLEASWVASFDHWVRHDDGRPFLGMDAAFTRFGPNAAPKDHWQPVLVLNGTSVTTGRRILTTHLAATSPPAGAEQAAVQPRRLFMDSYDLFELRSGQAACIGGLCNPPGFEGHDIALATGASNSARFPIISPPGTLRGGEGADAPVVDRIVDGGYFENDGITTTIDLVRALTEAKLHPAVLHIANNPLPYPRAAAGQGGAAGATRLGWQLDGPAIPHAEDRSWFLFLRGPLGALFATRDARATYALRDLENHVDDPAAFAEVLVYGEPDDETPPPILGTCSDFLAPAPGTPLKDVSMSWWMSQPVQEYLDVQLALGRNCASLRQVREWLTRPERWKEPG